MTEETRPHAVEPRGEGRHGVTADPAAVTRVTEATDARVRTARSVAIGARAGRGPVLSRALRGLARLLVRLFYRRLDVVGLAHVPAQGPLLVVANHPNGLLDSLLLLATLPRPLRVLAAAPYFRTPVFGWVLRLAGAIPVHRHTDGRVAPAANDAMFAAATAALGRGEAIVLFPEGVSHVEPRLLPLRTGAARLLLAAEAAAGGRLGVTLLPVGLAYHAPGVFRTGEALVHVGAPIPTADLVAGAGEASGSTSAGSETPATPGTGAPAAVRALTARIATALRALILETGDVATLRLLQVATSVWHGSDTSPARLPWMLAALDVARRAAARTPLRLRVLANFLDAWARDAARIGIAPEALPPAMPRRQAARWALREALVLLAGLPFAAGGWLRHAVPYGLTALAVRLVRPEADMRATAKLLAGVVLYPLCWALEGAAAWVLGGPWGLALFVAWLLPGGVCALAWQARWERAVALVRGYRAARRDARRHRDLLLRRDELVDEMRALAALAGEGRDLAVPAAEPGAAARGR